jgi:hypothetical protein
MLIIRPGGRSVPLVLLFDGVVEGALVIGVEQGLAALGVLDDARDPGQSFKVKPGRILWRHEKEKNVDGLTVVGIEINPIR